MLRSHHGSWPAPRGRQSVGQGLVVLGALLLGACDGVVPSSLTAPNPPTAAARDGSAISAATQTLFDQSNTGIIALGAQSPILVADDFAVPTRTIWTITEMKLVLGTIFTTPPTIAVRSDNDGAPGPVIANPTVTILGHETSPEQWARVHLALASPLTLNPGRYWLSVEMGTHNPSWFMTVGASPYVHWSSDAGQTWAQVQGGGDVGFILYGTAATAETKTSDLLNTLGTLGLDAGILNSLQAKLRAALASIASGDDAGTCRALNDLANQISALSGKKLTEAQATDLLAEVDQIRQMIGC